MSQEHQIRLISCDEERRVEWREQTSGIDVLHPMDPNGRTFNVKRSIVSSGYVRGKLTDGQRYNAIIRLNRGTDVNGGVCLDYVREVLDTIYSADGMLLTNDTEWLANCDELAQLRRSHNGRFPDGLRLIGRRCPARTMARDTRFSVSIPNCGIM